MFDLNRRPILWAIVAPIQIKVVHSSLSYQQATYQTYDRRSQESPSGYCPLDARKLDVSENSYHNRRHRINWYMREN